MAEVSWSLHAGIYLADEMGIPASLLDYTSGMAAIGTVNGFTHRAIDCILGHRDIVPFPTPDDPRHVSNFTYTVRWLEPAGSVTALESYTSIRYSLACDLYIHTAELSGHTPNLFPFDIDTRARPKSRTSSSKQATTTMMLNCDYKALLANTSHALHFDCTYTHE
jgi:hypothetical protein